jgi:hypothetical protein
MILQEDDHAVFLALIEYLRRSHHALPGADALVLVNIDLDHGFP